MKTPSPEKDKNEPNVFNEGEQAKINSLESLLKARKNLLSDIEEYNPEAKFDDEDEDNDGLKEYRGIF